MKEKTITPWEFDLHEAERKGYGTIRLLVDGYNVTYQFIRGEKNTLKFFFFIDGQYLGKYSNKDSEIGKRFGRPAMFKMGKDAKKMLAWGYTKKQILEKEKEFNSTVSGYYASHSSAKTLIASLKKNNLSIELNTK